MFQFPWFASCTYVFSTRYSACAEWVPPFRDLWITVCLPTPQSLSQATTSFIASDCQGIHRMRFFTWPYNPKQSGYTVKTTFAENSHVALSSRTHKFYLSLITHQWKCVSVYIYHISEFLKNDLTKFRNQHSFMNVHFWVLLRNSTRPL